MRLAFLFVGGLLIVLVTGAVVRNIHPDRVVNEDQRDFLVRSHRAMHRRPLLFFALPLLVVVSGVVEQVLGLLRGTKPAGDVVLALVGVGVVVILARLWMWREQPSLKAD